MYSHHLPWDFNSGVQLFGDVMGKGQLLQVTIRLWTGRGDADQAVLQLGGVGAP